MEQLFDFSFFWNLFPIMFRYIDVTLGISLASLVLALLIAFVIAAAYYLNVPVLRQICGGWVSLFRGTPLLAQLFWICYGLPQLIVPMRQLSITTLIVLGVSFNASSYMSETLRGAFFGQQRADGSQPCLRYDPFSGLCPHRAAAGGAGSSAGTVQQLCGHHQAVVTGVHAGCYRNHGGGKDGRLDQPAFFGILYSGDDCLLADCNGL